ncbi:unnamed protein product [Linum trigynum]|uniref:MI domain-containing protein n=1 Tax=Linum trigynum TaxID=586398 RepID=A0AAV2E9U8_9ROSI
MERQNGEKSRREKRKEARKETKQRKNDSWLAHQKLKGLKKAEQLKTKSSKSNKSEAKSLKERSGGKVAPNLLIERDLQRKSTKGKVKDSVVARGNVKEKDSLKRKSQTGFEEFLQIEMQNEELLAHEDLEVEKRLAKKLKVKDKMLRGMDDGLNDLLGGMPSAFESFNEEDVSDGEAYPNENIQDGSSASESEEDMSSAEDTEETHSEDVAESDLSEPVDNEVEHEEADSEISSRKRRRRRKKSKQSQEGERPSNTENRDSGAESVDVGAELKEAVDVSAPLVGVKYIAPHLRSRAGDESEDHTQIRRRVRGLLNRLSEFNIESITGEMATIFRSLSRSVSTQIISGEVLAACSGGPRGNEQYAAVFAAFVAGMAYSVGQDFGAKLMASLAASFEDEYRKEDNLSLRNLTLLLSYLYIFGVCSSDLIYDFLIMLSKRLTEVDVSTILTVLQCCGMKIRGDDPAVMKNFIQTVQNRVHELKASSTEEQEKINGKRMEFMLETICDIKNNKKRLHGETSEHTRIKKWLQKLSAEDILLRGLKWSKLLDPHKKGQWWLSGDLAGKADDAEKVANTIDKELLEAQSMLQLAAAQRMNTDTRKAIFCIIMSGEDYVDAFEKLLRLDLPGKQDREIMRVLVECCLQEKVFNKYYTVLASKLCEHEKNHKFTLQFCIRDHFKELESMSLQRSMHLAKFVAEMVASFVLSLSVVKTIDFDDAAQLTPKRIMHFRMLFESIFEYPGNTVWNTFTRLAGDEELEPLRIGMEFFIREYVVKPNKALASKFKLAKRALNNVERVLM